MTPGSTPEPVPIGVIGVGSMGRHHARVCSALPGIDLVGVADADADRARSVAARYGTRALDREALFEAARAVSVAVPTDYHYEVASAAVDRGVDVLVEKPLVADPVEGRKLLGAAADAGVTLATGHVERHNPAVATLRDLVGDLDVIAVEARRLGPPLDRSVGDDVVLDLMIHDLDVVRSLFGGGVRVADAAGAVDRQYVTTTLRVDGGVLAALTASRVTQQKVRELSITARDCRVNVDYTDQSVRIHRHSLPEYRESDGDVRYRHESVTERPSVENGEPLAHEFEDFAAAVRDDRDPLVTGEDGLRAVELARRIGKRAGATRRVEVAR